MPSSSGHDRFVHTVLGMSTTQPEWIYGHGDVNIVISELRLVGSNEAIGTLTSVLTKAGVRLVNTSNREGRNGPDQRLYRATAFMFVTPVPTVENP